MKRLYKVIKTSLFAPSRETGFTGSWTACHAYCAEYGWVIEKGIMWSFEVVPYNMEV